MTPTAKKLYHLSLAFLFGTAIAFLLVTTQKHTDALTKVSDEYCTKVAVSQFSLWVEVRAKLKKSENPLTQLSEPERQIVDSNPKLKLLSEDVAKLQDIIMTTPIINDRADLALKQTYEKLNELIREPEANKSEIEKMKDAFASALKENAPDFMSACRNHVATTAGKCAEEFAADPEKFKDCADPKLKENTKLALDLVPGFKVISAANTTLKNTMSQLVATLGSL